MGSSPFDDEGVRTRKRSVVTAGVLEGYFLSSYTARKLGMTTTGNAGGSHNLTFSSTQTQAGDDFEAMLRKMGTGFLVTELIGQGVNYVSGDYSRGAFGYWVENGKIQHAVQEVTIAGNLNDMFRQIVAVGADVISRGTKTTGSIRSSRWPSPASDPVGRGAAPANAARPPAPSRLCNPAFAIPYLLGNSSSNP